MFQFGLWSDKTFFLATAVLPELQSKIINFSIITVRGEIRFHSVKKKNKSEWHDADKEERENIEFWQLCARGICAVSSSQPSPSSSRSSSQRCCLKRLSMDAANFFSFFQYNFFFHCNDEGDNTLRSCLIHGLFDTITASAFGIDMGTSAVGECRKRNGVSPA